MISTRCRGTRVGGTTEKWINRPRGKSWRSRAFAHGDSTSPWWRVMITRRNRPCATRGEKSRSPRSLGQIGNALAGNVICGAAQVDADQFQHTVFVRTVRSIACDGLSQGHCSALRRLVNRVSRCACPTWRRRVRRTPSEEIGAQRSRAAGVNAKRVYAGLVEDEVLCRVQEGVLS